MQEAEIQERNILCSSKPIHIKLGMMAGTLKSQLVWIWASFHQY